MAPPSPISTSARPFHRLPAWLTWLFVHLLYLVEFDNRLLVLVQWAWNYFTWNRGARLITGESPLPLSSAAEDAQSSKDPASAGPSTSP